MDLLNNILQLINEDEIEKAYELITENEADFGKNTEFQNAKAILCIKTGEYRTAINLLKKAIEIDPENQDLYYNLSYAYEMLDRLSQIGQSETDSDIVVKKNSQRVSHSNDSELPTRAQSAASAVEVDAALVSIVLLAYNNLDYTKLCVESIYKNTGDVNYELILVDNGSSDGTFEYFKNLPYHRRIVRLEENQGPVIGFNEGLKAARGKYIAGVCNDFIFTKNWLSNLVKCMESDERIGLVSPGGSNVSNFQQINLEFSNVDELHAKAAEYNVSDPTKWEERIRLLPCVFFVRREVLDIVGYYDPAFYYGEFADDDISFRVRRSGYKLIFCGDTFTHHFGSVTTGVEHIEKKSLQVSREIFKKKYCGIDAWTDVKYDLHLLSLIDTPTTEKDSKIKILAIDPRCGNTLVMAKNKLRKAGFNEVELYAFVQNPLYLDDLRTVCTEVHFGEINLLQQKFSGQSFDLVIFDEPLNEYPDIVSLCSDGLSLLKDSGEALLSIFNDNSITRLVSLLKAEDLFDSPIKNNMSAGKLFQWLDENSYSVEKTIAENHIFTSEDQNFIDNIINKVCFFNNKDKLREKLMINRYIAKISRHKTR